MREIDEEIQGLLLWGPAMGQCTKGMESLAKEQLEHEITSDTHDMLGLLKSM